jgi:peroxiredoxin
MIGIIYILLILSVAISATGQTSNEIFQQYLIQASKAETVSLQMLEKIKYFNSFAYRVDTMSVFLKRDKGNSILPSLFRVQHVDGTIAVFNGKEFKRYDSQKKSFFTYDSSNSAEAFIIGSGYHLLSQKFLPDDSNYISIGPNYKSSKSLDVVINNQSCYMISFWSDIEPERHSDGSFIHLPAVVHDSIVLTIAKSNFILRSFYRKVRIDDGSEQIEDLSFRNIYYDISIQSELFDITKPLEISVESRDIVRQDTTLKPGIKAPQFTLADEKDNEYRLSDYLGKVVLIDFWGTWCKWCIKSMPELQKIYDKYKDKGVILLGVSCSEPHGADPRKFMDDNKYNYQLLVQGDEVAKSYKVSGYPELYVIGKDGIIKDMINGYYPDLFDKLSRIIDAELER